MRSFIQSLNPGDTIASAEQLEKLMKLKSKKKQDLEYLKSKIASLKTSYCHRRHDIGGKHILAKMARLTESQSLE